MLRQQRTPELVRILVREGCEFVNETLRGEAGVRVSNRSPPLNGHANLGLMRFDRQVRLWSSPTPEPSTQKGGMDLNLLIRKACGLGCGRTVHSLELCSGPDLTGVFS